MFISKETTLTHLSNVDFFRLSKIFLRIFGIWPMDSGPLPIRFYINYVSLFLAAIFGIAHGFVNLNNLYLALQSFCGCIFELISWFKLAAFYYHRKKFTELMQTLSMYYNKDYDREEVEIYRKVIIYSTFAGVSLASGGLLTCTIYVFTPIIENLWNYLTGQPLVRAQPFNAVYPFIDHYSDRYFLPCYIHLTHGGYCTAIIFNGIDSIFIAACFHFAAQFQIIGKRIRKTFDNTKPDIILSAQDNKRLRQQLIEIIEDQIKIFELTDLFTEVFSFIILMHFISVALIIGIGSIDLIMAPESEKGLYAVYISTVMIQSFAYAYSGNELSTHSLDISKIAWNMNWHCIDLNNQKLFMLLLLRSQNAKYIKVPFFEVTLRAYTKIMSTAGSYITLLNKMLHK